MKKLAFKNPPRLLSGLLFAAAFTGFAATSQAGITYIYDEFNGDGLWDTASINTDGTVIIYHGGGAAASVYYFGPVPAGHTRVFNSVQLNGYAGNEISIVESTGNVWIINDMWKWVPSYFIGALPAGATRNISFRDTSGVAGNEIVIRQSPGQYYSPLWIFDHAYNTSRFYNIPKGWTSLTWGEFNGAAGVDLRCTYTGSKNFWVLDAYNWSGYY